MFKKKRCLQRTCVTGTQYKREKSIWKDVYEKLMKWLCPWCLCDGRVANLKTGSWTRQTYLVIDDHVDSNCYSNQNISARNPGAPEHVQGWCKSYETYKNENKNMVSLRNWRLCLRNGSRRNEEARHWQRCSNVSRCPAVPTYYTKGQWIWAATISTVQGNSNCVSVLLDSCMTLYFPGIVVQKNDRELFIVRSTERVRSAVLLHPCIFRHAVSSLGLRKGPAKVQR